MLYKGDTLYLDWLEDGIAELVFDAPGSVNKLDTATVASLGQALDVLEKQTELKGLLLRSNKAAFIVGADITEFLSLFLVPEEQLSQWLHFANSVFNRLEDLPVPTISAVNGYALGGGCELAMSCDIILAAGPNAEGKGGAKFGQPEVGLGITPGFSGTQRLPRRVGIAKAKELIFSGKVIGAAEAEKIGLVNAVYAPEELIPGAIAMAKSFTANAPIAVKYSKACIDRGMQMDIDNGIALENELFAMCFATADQKEGMSAFVEKRKEKHFQNK